MMKKLAVFLCLIALLLAGPALAVDLNEAGDLGEEQMKEKQELHEMKQEMGDVKSTIDQSMKDMQQLEKRMREGAQQQEAREFHLFARESVWETYSGVKVNCLSYNGKLPGPMIHVVEGDLVKIVLHNQMKVATSLTLHGMAAPHSVGGVPRSGAGLIGPGETYAFVFQAAQPGTFWYHPQVIHLAQKQLGLYGPIIVEPKLQSRPLDKDYTLMFSQLRHAPASSKTGVQSSSAVAWTDLPGSQQAEADFLINGKPAPLAAPIELRKGERVRLRLINASEESIPIYLSGHKLEVVGINGGDRLEPHVFRDTITLAPADRLDVEFLADNPGVWSLASDLAHQCTYKGKFPGGIACVVRYSEAKTRPLDTVLP